MGVFSSKISVSDPLEEEEDITKIEKEVSKNPLGISFKVDEKDTTIWEFLLYDVRARVTYTIILALIVVLGITTLAYNAVLDKEDRVIYGSCFVKHSAMLACRAGDAKEVTEELCVQEGCCWQDDENLPFKCYHSFPSSYQYFVSYLEVSERKDVLIAIDAKRNRESNMHDIRTTVKCIENEDENHLVVEIEKIVDESNHVINATKINQNFSCHPKKSNDTGTIGLQFAENVDDYFYLKIRREETNETLFDTRVGPLIFKDDYISFATILASPYFYGLKGGSGHLISSTVTYGAVNGFNNAELPFYMVLENSDRNFWHGILLETEHPFLVQVLPHPGVMHHIEGNGINKLQLHLFPGPHKNDVISQLHKYIEKKTMEKPYIPPYWSLGMHICRKGYDGEEAFSQIQKMSSEEEHISRRIPYDSDCIDEELRKPFETDEENYPNVENITNYLANRNKKLLLTQKMTVPASEVEEGWIQNSFIRNKADEIFYGHEEDRRVAYLDVMNPEIPFILPPTVPNFGGLVLIDNFPRNYNARNQCRMAETKLSTLLVQDEWVKSENFQTPKWGSVCPDAKHYDSKSHWNIHNINGEKGLEIVHRRLGEISIGNPQNIIKSTSSAWTNSLSFGQFNGLQVPFTWLGLSRSLEYVLRSFLLQPFMGTPICGSYFNSSEESTGTEQDLCLRWFQLGLWLPFARNTYGDFRTKIGHVMGPLDFSSEYRTYLISNIRQRYEFAPYYYSQFLAYRDTKVPPVTPISFHFHDDGERLNTFGATEQLMVGEALLIVPIVSQDLSKTAYFPKGTWYQMNGDLVWQNETQGSHLHLNFYLNSAQIFVRGGYAIPTLQHSEESLTLEEISAGNYSLLMPLNSQRRCQGSLQLPDFLGQKLIDFSLEETEKTLKIVIIPSTEDLIEEDPKINQIKIFGFPTLQEGETIQVNSNEFPDPETIIVDYNADHNRVRLSEIQWSMTNKLQLDVEIVSKI